MTEGRQAALLGVLAALLPALALIARLPSYPRILIVLHNAAHAPVFGALAVVWLLLLRRLAAMAAWQSYIAAFLLAVAFGGFIELIQPAFGRGAEMADLRNDALGAIAGLALFATIKSGRIWPAAIALLALAPVTWPIVEASIAYASRASEFPTLLGNNSAADRYFIQTRGVEIGTATLPQPWSRRGDPPSLKVRIIGGNWPGVSHDEPQPDWRGYSRLMLDMTNPDTRPLTLTLRVHDRDHDNRIDDRFNQIVELAGAQRRTVIIPLDEISRMPAGRPLDLVRVAGLIIFSSADPALVGRNYYITRVWLD